MILMVMIMSDDGDDDSDGNIDCDCDDVMKSKITNWQFFFEKKKKNISRRKRCS